MSTPLSLGAVAPAARATRWRHRAAWLLTVGVGVSALVVLALSASSPDQVLDPDDTGPQGAKALVEVLRDHGVTVEVVRSIDALAEAEPGPGTTVVMGNPSYLGHDNAATMGEVTARADRLVLLSPTAEQLAALDLPVTSGPVGDAVPVTAGCDTDVARRDDAVEMVDVRFIPRPLAGRAPAGLCFGLPDLRGGSADGSGDDSDGSGFRFGAAMATVPVTADHCEVVALGFGAALTNRFVDERSHAGLAVRSLGHSPRLLWYQPGIGDLANPGGSAPSPWPEWLTPVTAVLASAVVVLALVRGRRLGALVTEPLPVVVRAVETTESRGRIYRRARDRARAAAVLRTATTDRLARRLAVPPRSSPALHAAAAAASGLPPAQVAALLTGPPPTTDAELHALATALTDLEERVRTS